RGPFVLSHAPRVAVEAGGGGNVDTGARYPIELKDFFPRPSTETGRPMATTKYVYSFGSGEAEGSAGVRHLLGGKGGEVGEVTQMGIRVPPGFTIPTQAWAAYNRTGRSFPDGLWPQVEAALEKLEEDAGLALGDPKRPLLVSVRSGARVSMPGMMETVLNLGLNDETVEGLAARTHNERFAWDC